MSEEIGDRDKVLAALKLSFAGMCITPDRVIEATVEREASMRAWVFTLIVEGPDRGDNAEAEMAMCLFVERWCPPFHLHALGATRANPEDRLRTTGDVIQEMLIEVGISLSLLDKDRGDIGTEGLIHLGQKANGRVAPEECGLGRDRRVWHGE